MNIIIINGSPRANGATGKVLSKISETITEMDSNIVINHINLTSMNLQFCTGCASCYATGECIIKEDGIELLSKSIEVCDGIIFGSPTYESNVPGQLKTLMDRGHFVFEQLLHNKACLSVITYENYGRRKVQRVIDELIRFSGGSVCCRYSIKLNHGENALKIIDTKQIEKKCNYFLAKVKRKNPLSPYERLKRAIVFHVGIKPHVMKNESRYKGVKNRWIKQGLIPEGR